MERFIETILLDDHSVILKGLECALTADEKIQVCGSFIHSNSLFQYLEISKPDLLIADYVLSPGDISGKELISKVQKLSPETVIIVMTGNYNRNVISTALASGATGVLSKKTPLEKIPSSLKAVLEGKVVIYPAMSDSCNYRRTTTSNQKIPGNSGRSNFSQDLSVRERSVIQAIIQGKKVTEIARDKCRSVKTISSQKQSALKKTGYEERTGTYP